MKNIIRIIASIVAVLIGLLSIITGSRVLLGYFNPGYQTFVLLISYNIMMGFVSILAGYFIWKKHYHALIVSGFIATGHICVLISLAVIFSDIVAEQSIKAMIFRSIVWVIILIITFTTAKKK